MPIISHIWRRVLEADAGREDSANDIATPT
jgi:hypothetical protein